MHVARGLRQQRDVKIVGRSDIGDSVAGGVDRRGDEAVRSGPAAVDQHRRSLAEIAELGFKRVKPVAVGDHQIVDGLGGPALGRIEIGGCGIELHRLRSAEIPNNASRRSSRLTWARSAARPAVCIGGAKRSARPPHCSSIASTRFSSKLIPSKIASGSPVVSFSGRVASANCVDPRRKRFERHGQCEGARRVEIGVRNQFVDRLVGLRHLVLAGDRHQRKALAQP